jgi:predicted lactoylglutathione lyase
MNEERLNQSIRKFLKSVGVNSQRELEQAVAKAIEGGALAGNETFDVTMTLDVKALKLSSKFNGQIELE